MKKAKLFFSTVFMLIAVSLFAQNVRVSGTVKDASNGEGVPFASVVVKGTTSGVSSDADGNYTISAPANGTLEISAVGYTTLDVAIAGQSVINFVLEPNFEALAETIVVAFGSTTKEAFTGSAAVVRADDLQKRATTNVTNALVGSVPGLQIKGASGAPGAGSGNINIRGLASVQASMDPLIIVDGAPYPASLTNIPQNDIESVTVLKDAASAALYGARGAAGVILVTTKRGRSADAQVNFDARVGVNSRAVVDHDVITDPAQFYEAYYTQLYNYHYYGQGETAQAANAAANADMLTHLGYNVYTIPDGQLLIGADGKLNPNATLGRSYKFNGETYYMQPDNWRDLAYKNAVRQEYNVSVNGGTNRSSFYASMGYLNEDGIIEYSGYERLSARVRADYQAKDWLKIGANVSFVNSAQRSNPNMGTDLGSTNLMYYTTFIAPIYPIYVRVLDDAGNPVIRTDEFGHEQYDYGVASSNYGVGRGFMQTGNPFGSNRYNAAQNKGKQLNGTFTVDIDITPHLHANVSTTVNWGNTLTTTYDNPFYGPKAGVNGELYKASSTSVRTNNIQTLTYANTFNRHYINLMVGHEYYKATTDSQGITAQGGFSPDILEVNAFANVLYSGTTSSSSMYNVEGYFLSAQYDFDKRYYLSASYRRDASSRFATNHRWGNFWSVGAAWIISKEPFMASASWIDQLKLKASIGQQGNDAITNYAYIDTYSLSKSTDIDMTPSFNMIGNENITWETTTNSNVGVEFSFWRGRLAGSLDAYYKKTANLLFWISIPESAGSRGYYGNIGDIANKGLELSLSVVPVRTRNVEWTISGNISTNKAVILKLPEGKMGKNGGYYESPYWWTPGGEMRNYMNYEYAGVSDQGEALYWYDEDLSSLGKAETTITNQPGKKHSGTTTHIGEATRYALGSLLPKFFGGISTTLRIWDFDLSATFDYQIGGRILDNTYAQLMTPARTGSDGGYNYSTDIFKAWSPTNTGSSIPRWQFGDTDAAAGSSRWLTNASYINFQSFAIGYNIPVRRLGIDKYISRIRIYAVGENLGYLSARKGFDPRASMSSTATVNTYSPVRNISGGIQVTF